MTILLVGDAMYLLKDEVIGSVAGNGVGTLKEHFNEVGQAEVPIFVSRMSSNGRGVTEPDLRGKNAEFVSPTKLVELATQSDTVLTLLVVSRILSRDSPLAKETMWVLDSRSISFGQSG